MADADCLVYMLERVLSNVPKQNFLIISRKPFRCIAFLASCSFPMFNRYGSRSYECCKREKTTSHSCGISTVVHGRIINGVDSIIKQWPWMVTCAKCLITLFHSNVLNGKNYCSVDNKNRQKVDNSYA